MTFTVKEGVTIYIQTSSTLVNDIAISCYERSYRHVTGWHASKRLCDERIVADLKQFALLHNENWLTLSEMMH